MAAYSIVFIRLFIFLAATVPANLDTISCDDGTEVCLLPSDAVEPYNISCKCHASSIHCHWTTLADRRTISSGTTESLLVWHSSTRGYGQFTCISQAGNSSDRVERNVLIIPNAQRMSCDGCISTTICTTTTGKCRLRFSKLFNLSSQCELHVDFLNGTRNVNTFTEGKYMDLLPNSSYYIQCHTPTCPNVRRDIYYIIPTSIVEDCSNSDLCTTTTTMSTFSVSVPPTFVFSNDSVLSEERITLLGSDMFINCSVNYGTEYNTTSWLFDYEPLPINQTSRFRQNTSGLTIYNVTESNEGYYICYIGEIRAFIHLRIARPPVLVSKQNQTIIVNVKEEVALNCNVSSVPDPVYSWSFPPSCSSCPNTSSKNILTFIATDSGEYTCVAENEYGNLSVTFNVTVIIPPTFVFSNDSILFEERIVLLESDVFINCSVNYRTEYNTTSWLFDYEPLLINQTSRFRQSMSGLTIYNVTESNEGYYICYVGEIRAFIHLRIARPPVLVSKQNQTIIVNVKEEVALNCSVSSVPDPVYSWSFPESCSSCPNTSSKNILAFIATDSGEYTCVAENEYGNLLVTFNVTVIIPPTFVFSNDSVLFEERITLLESDVFINCSVNYGTEYNITSWLFDYEPLLINQTSRFRQNTSGLTICNVTKLDEGYYSCHVDHLRASILLHVEGPPTLVSISDQTVRVNISEEVILNCSVSSLPDPVYSWSFPDSCSSCPHSYNYSILTFTADSTDSGEYICTAENKHGNISVVFDIFVNVTATPLSTHSEHLVSITASSTTMIPTLDASNGNEDNNVWAIIATTIAEVLVIPILLMIIGIIVRHCFNKNKDTTTVATTITTPAVISNPTSLSSEVDHEMQNVNQISDIPEGRVNEMANVV